MMACLFLLVFAISLGIIFDTDISLDSSTNNSANIAEAGGFTGRQIAVNNSSSNSYSDTASNVDISSGGTLISSPYNRNTNPNNAGLISNFYCDSDIGSPELKWYQYGNAIQCGWGFAQSTGSDEAFVYWLEYKFDEELLQAIKNVGVSYRFVSNSRFDDGTNDESAAAINFIDVHPAPTRSVVHSGRSFNTANWTDAFKTSAQTAAYNNWSNGDVNTFTMGAQGYNASHQIPSNATGIRLIFGAISDGNIAGGFTNINLTLYYNTTSITLASGANGSISPTTLSPFTSTAQTQTVTVTPDEGYYFAGWSNNGAESGIIARNESEGGQRIVAYDFKGSNILPGTTYTAIFKEGYTIKFNANGGIGNIADVAGIPGSSVSIPTVVGALSNEGKYFTGWNTSADGSGTRYTNASTITGTSGQIITLYAQWADISYSFSFREGSSNLTINNGATINFGLSGNTSNLPVSITIPDLHQTRTFIGWRFANNTSSPIVMTNQITAAKLTEFQTNILTSTITRTCYAAAIDSDFGRNPNSTAAWGSQANPYLIITATHLSNLGRIVNGTQTAQDSIQRSEFSTFASAATAPNATVQASSRTYSGCYFVVQPSSGTSIAVNSNFVRIGTDTTYYFAGNFNGNNNTLQNVAASGQYSGLFGYISGATISNLTLSNVSISGENTSHGGLVGAAAGTNTITDCTVSSGTVRGTHQVGGIVGFASGSVTITNCTNRATVYTTATNSSDNNRTSAGGIVGYIGANGRANITNATNTGAVYCTNNSGVGVGGIIGYSNGIFTINGATNSGAIGSSSYASVSRVGGIVGTINGNGSIYGTVSNSGNVNGGTMVGGIVGYSGANGILYGTFTNTGSVSGATMTGGIGGQIHAYLNSGTTYGVFNNNGGTITGSGDSIGGCFGFTDRSLRNATNTRSVTGAYYVGGVVGRAQGAIKGCKNTGAVTTTSWGTNGEASNWRGAFGGGIVGYVLADATISNCYNGGAVRTSSNYSYSNYIGGITAHAQTAITYCVNAGTVSGSESVGGIAGYTNSTINYCYNLDAGINGLYNSNKHGTIRGENAGTMSNSWDIKGRTYTGTGSLGFFANYMLTTAGTVTGIYSSGSGYASSSWEDITRYDYIGFQTAISIANGYYLRSTSTDSGADVTPTAGCINLSGYTIASTSYATPMNVGARFLATTGYNLSVASEIFTVSTTNRIYSGSNQASVLVTSVSPAFGSVYGVDHKFYTGSMGGTYVAQPTNAATYYIKTDITIGGVVVGRRTNTTATINKSTITLTHTWTSNNTTALSNSFIYNAAGQGISGITVAATGGAPTNVISYSGSRTAVNVGSYSYTATITDTTNYQLSGGGVERTYTYEITKCTITVTHTWTSNDTTALSNTFIYNAAEQGIASYSFVSNTAAPTTVYSTSDNQKGIDVRRYEFTISLTDTHNYQLRSGTTVHGDSITYVYTITKYDITNGTGDSTELSYLEENGFGGEFVWFKTGDSGKDGSSKNEDRLVVILAHKFGSANTFTNYEEYIAAVRDAFNSYFRLAFLANDDSTKKTIAGTNADDMGNVSVAFSMNKFGYIDGGEVNFVITVSDDSVNFTGTLTVKGFLIFSDFGGDYNAANWGGADNPYLIENPTHLFRLSQIVNGTTPAWNSINNGNTSIALYENTKAVAQFPTYKGAYFKLANNVDISAYSAFAPIGIYESSVNNAPFSAADFNGNNSTITLDIQSNARRVGLFGYVKDTVIENLTVDGSVSAITKNNYMSHVGGIVGHAENTSILSNTSNATINSATLDTSKYDNSHYIGGDYVGGIVGYAIGLGSVLHNNTNNGAVNGGSFTIGETYIGSPYVGGIVGYAEDCMVSLNENTAAITGVNISNSCTGGIIGNAGGAIVTDNTNSGDVVGLSHVGGIVGRILAFSSATGAKIGFVINGVNSGNITAGGSYAGGIVGYAVESEIQSDKVDGLINSGTISAVGNFAGGIVGLTYSGKFTATVEGSVNNSGNVTAVNYVGGVAGAMGLSVAGGSNQTSPTQRQIVKPIVSGTISGVGYLGGLFGFVYGSGYGDTPISNDAASGGEDAADTAADGSEEGSYIRLDGSRLSASIVVTAATDGQITSYIGGLAGYLEKTVIILTNSLEFTGTLNAQGASYVGGYVGYLGKNAGMISDSTPTDGAQISVTNNKTITNGGNYVGGIFGAVAAGAGVYNSTVGEYSLAQNISLINSATVRGANYVGGLVGMFGESAANAVSHTTRYSPDYNARNHASVTASANYAGGLFGYVGFGAVLTLENDTIDNSAGGTLASARFFNGATTDTNITITAAGYAGGIVGYLENSTHSFVRVYNKGRISVGTSGSYAGGLFGYMGGGAVSECFSSPTGTISVYTNAYSAASYVGGITGYMNAGTVTNCYTQGFLYTRLSVANGGVVGFKHATNATVIDSWAIMLASNPTYESISANEYGKFIVLDQSVGVLMSISELAVVAGLFSAQLTTDIKASRSSLAAEYGKISIAANVPSENRQLVFYDGSGYDTSTEDYTYDMRNKDVDESNEVVRVRLANTEHSMIVAVWQVDFRNVPQKVGTDDNSTANKTNFIHSYIYPSLSSNYVVEADELTLTYDAAGYISRASGTIYFIYKVTEAGATNRVKVGSFSLTFTAGSDATPFLISSQADWDAFALNVYNGVNQYSGQTVRLMVDVSVRPGNNSFSRNGGYNLAGDLSDGEQNTLSTNHYFMGTFDGNGHSITINYSGTSPRVSVFANAAGATFKNLTINGSIWSSSYDIAAFVAKPFGNLTFTNCTSNVTINALRLAAGFAGYTRGFTITCIACINSGNITTTEGYTSTYGNYGYGTGGIIANVENTTTLESCKNTGNIVGGASNVGGIVGRSNAPITFYNCANTGNVSTTQTERFNIFACVGGIIGKISATGYLRAYACYNTGTITAQANFAGGIVGCIGDYYPKENTGADEVRVAGPSTISYCYNTGAVNTGGTSSVGGGSIWFGGRINLNGTQAGGIAGTIGSGTISYSYNTGKVTSYGCSAYTGSWQTRVGGIVGESVPQGGNRVDINYCYNVGLVENAEGGTDARYGATIVGYMDQAANRDNTHVSNTYALAYTVKYNNTYYKSWNLVGGEAQWVKTGTILDSIADFTAVYSANNGDGDNADRVAPVSDVPDSSDPASSLGRGFGYSSSAKTLVSENGTDINYMSDSSFVNGTAQGWVYVYGCLPQLAVFALDTQNGLSMLSTSYGKDQYGEYQRQHAGDALSPYIIKDGIDLMGLSALVSAQRTNYFFNLEGEYIEFADGTNNVDGAKSAYINMDTYMYASSLSGTANQRGKSYHLYSLGAVNSNGPNPNASGAKTAWLSRNYRYNESSASWVNNVDITTINFYPIGVYGRYRFFGGNISGLQTDGRNTEIRNLKVDYTDSGSSYAGLFGRVQDATISNITVCGSVVGRTTTTGGEAFVGGIASYTGGTTIIDGCQAGTSANPLRVEARSRLTGALCNAGGIVGNASTVWFDNTTVGGSIDNMSVWQRYSFIAGSTLTLRNCVSYATVSGFKDNIGGIIGYATASETIDGHVIGGGHGTTVRIDGCKVLGGTLSAYNNSSVTYPTCGTNIGGIGGGRDNTVIYALTNCEVGSNTALAPTTAKVTIRGENSLGGILAKANGDTNVFGCSVYGDVLIERTTSTGGGTCRNNSTYGTAIGGILGYSDGPCTIGSNGTYVNVGFYGTIIADFNSQSSTNIGGIVGFLGEGASIASGNITVKGSITASNAGTQNVGGVIGMSANSAYGGLYDVAPTITATYADNVGGFIGKNIGTCVILAADVEIKIKGTILGSNNIGGFIGLNSADSQFGGLTALLEIAPKSYNSQSYDGGLIIEVECSVDGASNIGGIVGNNSAEIRFHKGTITNKGNIGNASSGAQHIGGVIGANIGIGSLNISSTTSLDNKGQVGNTDYNPTLVSGRQAYVGGIIGYSEGSFEAASAMSNSGAVYGYHYVGGSIGALISGTIAGNYSNSGTVIGVTYVGGVIGMVDKDGILASQSQTGTQFSNTGIVVGANSITNQSLDVTEDALTEANQYIGGSIGAMFGQIYSATGISAPVLFQNQGRVYAYQYSGGNVGVVAGTVSNAQFVNSGALTFAGGDGLGGSIGYIGGDLIVKEHSLVSFTQSHSEYYSSGGTTSLDVTGASSSGGGVGGVIGTIDSAFSGSTWADNTFYVNGNVTATKANNVGGVVGWIKKGTITIANMLAYDNTITGNNNVGGIVGSADAGVNLTLSYCYNVTISADNNAVEGESNVGGIIGNAAGEVDASTSYWIKGFSNEALTNSDINNLGTTLNATYKLFSKTLNGELVTFNAEFCNTHDVNAFATQYLGEASPQYTGWDHLMQTQFESDKPRLNASGDWIVIDSSGKAYTTGKDNTGWYYVYATDGVAAAGASKDINTLHSSAATGDLTNLNYWKYIANAFSVADITNGLPDIIAAATSPIILNSAHTNGGGEIVAGFIYASAAAGTKDGMYLYMLSSDMSGLASGGLTDADGNPLSASVYAGDSYYIRANSDVENVLIFYKEIGLVSSIVYNGMKRYAPLLDTILKYEVSATADNHNQYVYTLNGDKDGYNFGTNTGSYYVDATIYFYDSLGNRNPVGSIVSSNGSSTYVWRITDRPLDITIVPTGDKTQYDGLASKNHFFTATVDNIAGGDVTMRNITLTFDGTNKIPITLLSNLNTGTEASFIANGWYYTASVSSVGAMSDDDTKYNATDNLTATDSTDSGLYRLVVVVYYVNSGTYKMSIKNKPSNYRFDEVAASLEIARRTLTVRQNLETAVYNGADHPLVLTFSNWATGEQAALQRDIINGFRPSASSVNDNELNTSVGNTTYTVTGIINVDVYTVSLGSTTSGNYEVALDKYSMTVTINRITVSWDSTSNKTYDGQATTLTATFTAQSAFANATALRTAVEGFAWTASNTTNRAIKSATTGVVVVEMTAGPNVGRYSPSVRDPNSETNTNYSLGGTRTRSAYEIRQKALTLSFTQSGSSPYIYNTNHQGLTRIDISGFVNGETISDTGARGSGIGFTVNLSPSGAATDSGNGYNVSDCIYVGDYTAVVELNNTSNYYIEGEDTAKWEIDKKIITISGLVNNSGSSSVVYDAKLHTFSVGLAADADISGSSDTSFAFGNDKLSFSVTYASGNTNGVINAGTYDVKVGADNFSAVRNGTPTNTSANYELQGAQSVRFEITPCKITEITWTNAGSGTSTGQYVYTAALQGATIATVTYSDGTVSPVATTSVTQATVKGLGEDVLTFRVDGAATDVGNHSSTAVYVSVSGTNSGISSITGNYTLPSTTTSSANFSIYKSIVRVSTNFIVSKIYDATTEITDNMLLGISYSFASINGGANNASVGSVSARYDSANVGNGKTVHYTVGISQSANGNYQFESNSISNNNGIITPRTVTITLNLRSNRAYMTYSGETLYGSATNSSSNVSCRSSIYRSGQGFTVSNLPEKEASDALVIQANFIEADRSRSAFDAYVNNIVNNDGVYSTVASGYYKALVFSLSGDSSTNYSFNVDGYHSAAVAAGSNLTVYDSRDNAVGHDNDPTSGNLYLSIDKKTITANYENTQQSYATENNTYNTDWLDIVGSSSGIVDGDNRNVDISVINNWMYIDNNPANEKRMYTSYTVINGTAAAREGLGAQMTSTNGSHLNYVLRNQPSLIIGYFVSAGDYYEVSTFAGLMLATYYYQLNFTGFDEVPIETVWISFCTAEQYEKREGMPEGYDTWDAYFAARIAEINSDPDYLYLSGGSTALTIDDIVYEDESDRWGVWADKYVDTSTVYKSFRQTANISGTLTAYDISLLEGQFGDNWGVGKGYLNNFIYTEQGSIVTAIGSIFADVTYVNEKGETVTVPFVGTYDGNGYVIDGFNILAYASGGEAATLNIGMFSRIGSGLMPKDTVPSNGKVTGVNLRNVNITVSDYSGNANTINVGGIVGSSQQTTSIENSSAHLNITIYSTGGTVNVGGLIGEYGYYETGVSSVAAVNGVISLGSIYVNAPTVNAGGIIGLIASNSVGYVNNAVSMTEIFSTSQNNTIGGLIGSASGASSTAETVLTSADGKQNGYLTDSIVNMTTGEAVNYAVGNIPSSTGIDVSYSTLYAYSVSGYNAQGVYYRLSTDSADNRGRYDVLSDGKVMLNNDGDGNYSQSSMYESSRLADIIDIYILLYAKTATTTSATSGGDTAIIDVYAKSSSSWLVGTAKGTDSSQIAIANQQHVGLLRMLRFASFRLVADVTMYTNHSDALYSGAFYGKVTNTATVEGAQVTYTINLRNSNGNNPAKMFEVELSAHSLPLKKDTV